MNKSDRERITELNALRFSNMDTITLKKAVEAKQARKKALASLTAQQDTYSAEYIAKQKEKVRRDYAAQLASLGEEVLSKIDELKASTLERHSGFEIDEVWLGVLKTIEMGGSSLDYNTIRQLVSNFAYDQPRLRALQKVFKERGISSDGGIDKMLYDIEGSFNRLREAARATFIDQSASINTFANAAAKIARLEGFSFEANPDPDGFSEAVSRGAGLPVLE